MQSFATIRRLLTRRQAVAEPDGDGTPGPGSPAAPAVPRPRPPRPTWSDTRLAITDQLWGPGYIVAGGEIEILRLARPLGLSQAASLLIVGVGNGGAAGSVVRNFGAWVTGMESDPALIAAAQGFVSRAELNRKVRIEAWHPDKPFFQIKGFHHILALEPLHGAQPEPILDALAKGLKPGGQLVLTGLAAAEPLSATDPTVARWAKLEQHDPAAILAPKAISRMLARVGLDVRIVEDISQRHMDQVMLGWRVLVRELSDDDKPDRVVAAHLVAEAEMWLLRRRLIREGKLRLIRWHSISRIPIV